MFRQSHSIYIVDIYIYQIGYTLHYIPLDVIYEMTQFLILLLTVYSNFSATLRCPIWSRGAEDTSLEHLLPKADLYAWHLSRSAREKCRVMLHLYTGIQYGRSPTWGSNSFATSPLNFANLWKDVERTPDQSIISTCAGISYNFWWLCLTFEPNPVNEIDSELDEEEQRELHDYMEFPIMKYQFIKKSLNHIQIGV